VEFVRIVVSVAFHDVRLLFVETFSTLKNSLEAWIFFKSTSKRFHRCSPLGATSVAQRRVLVASWSCRYSTSILLLLVVVIFNYEHPVTTPIVLLPSCCGIKSSCLALIVAQLYDGSEPCTSVDGNRGFTPIVCTRWTLNLHIRKRLIKR
jgi:hypothetical protein